MQKKGTEKKKFELINFEIQKSYAKNNVKKGSNAKNVKTWKRSNAPKKWSVCFFKYFFKELNLII